MSDRPQKSADAASPGVDIVRVDEVCDRYEAALRSGGRPDMAEAIEGFEGETRTALLGELFLLEMQYARESNPPETPLVDQIRNSHPELTGELDHALGLVKHRLGFDKSSWSRTATFSGDRPYVEGSSGSRVFRVACPNCKETCAVATDSDSTVVTCSLCGSSFDLSHSDEKTCEATELTTIGHFKLTTRLGMGGCGTVWKAYDSQLDRTVAVKVPRAGQLTPGEEERFRREAQTVARLKHPYIVPIHEFGRDGDLLYFVSEFIRGVALDSWVTAKRTSIRQTAELVAKLAEALHYAHGQGVIHRDVKPSNILMDVCGDPHLTDFGLAMLSRPDVSHESDGFLGTPAYMSPEQAAGEAHRCDARTDVYGLGVVLFQLLTGELPFRGNREMLLYQIQFEDAESPRNLNSNIPKDLETICVKSLQKPMAARYESAGEMAEDLRRYLRGEPIAARPVSAPARAWRWCLRNRVAAAALAMLMFIAVAGPVTAAYQSSLRGRAERAEAETRRYYKQYIAQGIVPPPDNYADRRVSDANMSTISNRLIDSAHQHATKRIRLLHDDASTDEQRAYLHLAAGLLAEAMAATEEAVSNLELAADALTQLHAEAPGAMRYEAALAFCKLRLVRHYTVLENYDASPSTRRKAEEAATAWKQLVDQQPNNLANRKNYAEAQLWLSLDMGEERAALDVAKQAAQTLKEIEARWPDDERQLYLIACQLAGAPPLLEPRADGRDSPR